MLNSRHILVNPEEEFQYTFFTVSWHTSNLVAWYLFGPGALFLFCLVSEPGRCGPGTFNFFFGIWARFFLTIWTVWARSKWARYGFFFAWYLSQVSVGQEHFYIFAWYLGPNTRCASWRWKRVRVVLCSGNFWSQSWAPCYPQSHHWERPRTPAGTYHHRTRRLSLSLTEQAADNWCNDGQFFLLLKPAPRVT